MRKRIALFTRLLLPASLGVLVTTVGAQNASSAGAARTAGKAKAKSTADSGAPITVGVQELIKNREKLDGKKVVLEGMVTDICKHRGCWAMVHDLDSDAQGQVRVKQDDNQSNFKAFLPEHQGKTVVVTGELHETRIDTAYLDKWEARVKAPAKEASQGEEAEHSQEAVLKQIAGLREKLAKSGKSYLSSLQVAVDKWEVKGDSKTDAKAKRS
jgi:hypothetical protein